MSEDRLITLKEFRETFGMAPSTERRMRKEGVMPPSIRIGRKVYYRTSTVQQWIADRERVNP